MKLTEVLNKGGTKIKMNEKISEKPCITIEIYEKQMKAIKNHMKII